MRYKPILFVFTLVCVLTVTGEKGDNGNHNYQGKSYNKHRNEKSFRSHHQKTESRVHLDHFNHLTYRDGVQHCQVLCKESDDRTTNVSTENQVIYNGEDGLFSFLNESSEVAIILDYVHNVSVTLDGKSGTAIVEDRSKQKYYTIEKKSQTEEVLWLATKTDFKAYFKNLSSLQNFVKIGEEHGKTVDLQEVFKLEISYLSSFGINPETNYALSIELTGQLNSTLKFIYRGQGSFYIRRGISGFVKLNLAFSEIFHDCQSELEALNLKLNVSSLFESKCGVEAFINILRQIGNRLDFSKIIKDRSNIPERLLKWLQRLSEGSNHGDDGIFNMIITIIRAANGQVSLNDAINALLNYRTGYGGSSISKMINEVLDLLESQNRVYSNSEYFREIITILKSLNDNNLIFNNINVSDIIALFTSGNPVTMFRTLYRMFIRFINGQNFPECIHHFIQYLNSTDGLNVISRIFPGVDLNHIRNVITSVLSRIPIIGSIFNTNSSFVPGFNISNIMSSNPFSEIIQNAAGSFVNATSGIQSGIPNAVNTFIGGILGPGSSGTPPPPTSEIPSSPTSTTAVDETENRNADLHHLHLHSSNRHEHVQRSQKQQHEGFHHDHLGMSQRHENVHPKHHLKHKESFVKHHHGEVEKKNVEQHHRQ